MPVYLWRRLNLPTTTLFGIKLILENIGYRYKIIRSVIEILYLNGALGDHQNRGLPYLRNKMRRGEYLLLMINPPKAVNYQPMPRELTLVIDKSGSMEGASMAQAISALQQALRKLTAEDRFNVIAFNHQMRSLFNQPVAANQYNISQATRFVASLEADGGTEMMPALRSALSEPVEDGFVRQVVFLTDGAVSNEDELFAVIHADLGRARLFTIGIGSAPNSYFMRKAAQFGRGTFTYIGDTRENCRKNANAV